MGRHGDDQSGRMHLISNEFYRPEVADADTEADTATVAGDGDYDEDDIDRKLHPHYSDHYYQGGQVKGNRPSAVCHKYYYYYSNRNQGGGSGSEPSSFGGYYFLASSSSSSQPAALLTLLPLFIILITLLELGFFTYYTIWNLSLASSSHHHHHHHETATTGAAFVIGPSPSGSGSPPLPPIDSIFIFRPDKRHEIWRFFLYMLLHAGWLHLLFNLLVQLLSGIPLEVIHGSTRIALIYLGGVLAGSLGTSVLDQNVYLVGASGGVYALLGAHLANILLNYKQLEFGLLRLLGIFLIGSVDIGFAIYDRYNYKLPPAPAPVVPVPLGVLGMGTGTTTALLEDELLPPISYVAHFTGALAGLLIGLVVLKSFEDDEGKRVVGLGKSFLRWSALAIYLGATLFAVLFNLVRN